MLDSVKAAGGDVIAVGKITDIYAGKGITRSIFTHSNAEGMEVTLSLLAVLFLRYNIIHSHFCRP